MKSVFLLGSRIYLRPLAERDVCGPYLDWLNDREVCRGNSHHVFPYTESKAASFITESIRNDSLVLAIVTKEENLHIGNIALQRIHWVYRTAELAILLGDRNSWGKGYGAEAAQLIVEHGFSNMNFVRIECATFETNEAMCKLAKSLGMKQEGVRRKAAFKEGQYLDVIEFGLLKEEFTRV